jgi:hypothetical protein
VGTQHRDVIEINGKKYDAVTGKMIKENDGGSGEEAVTVQSVVPQAPQSKGAVLDGFTRRPAHGPGVSHKKHTQKSQTLMRTAVQKPTTAHSSKKKTMTPEIQKVTAKTPPAREFAAQNTHKSPHISKYGDVSHSSVVKKVEHLPVKHPEHATEPTKQAKKQEVSTHTTNARQIRQAKTDAVISRALTNAHGHEQPPHHVAKRTHRRKLAHRLGITPRAMAVSSSVLAVALLVGFFAIQNIPNVSMRVAAARAGFSATMPGYEPAGFGFKGPIQYDDGQVRISFSSHSDGRTYSVVQRESSWNSDALLSNFVVAQKKQFQTYIDRGRTLYIYDGSNATWVDNGVWYQIEGNASMTTDQLVRIAASI